MKRKKGFKIVRIIIIFLVIVIAGTVMSRFASNTLTPKVEIMYASSGSISRDVVQDVMIESDSRTPVYSYPDLLVQAIYVHTGSYVKKGDKLMKIKAEELSSTYLTKKLERKNLKEQYVYAWGDERALVEANIADVDRQLNYLEKLADGFGLQIEKNTDLHETVAALQDHSKQRLALTCATWGSPFTLSSHFEVMCYADDEWVYFLDPLRDNNYAKNRTGSLIDVVAPGVVRIPLDKVYDCNISSYYIVERP